ncbi:MAG: hypothetical protein H6983_12455 [Ectothiorhodospiraceae bacterium]|nr:hypothetical protein [Chromatiales bacterium]MCP5154973.1 hypothetical protein [Ectothiorhodospiraceae bacterium]
MRARGWLRTTTTALVALVVLGRVGEPVLGATTVGAGVAGAPVAVTDGPMTLTFRDTPIEEVFQMLSRQGRVNILLGRGVTGSVSVNLYAVGLEHAIEVIAETAGFVAERRGDTWMVVARDDAGRESASGRTTVRTYKVQYTDPEVVATVLEKHLSRYGKITRLGGRNLLVVEELSDFHQRIERLIGEVDQRPRQILIEAKILEITLNADDTFGIDWSAVFESGQGAFGARGLSAPISSGFFLRLVSPELQLFIDSLSAKGRVRTLSTPRLMVLEHQPAEVLVGDRLGFRVTTTVNQVTTESVEFVESGVILKVRASVDRDGQILMELHPEVSNGSISEGIPSVRTTELTTQLLAHDGQQIFIGGLIRTQARESRSGLPVLSEVPLLGGLFSRTETATLNTETVVMISPRLVDADLAGASQSAARKVLAAEQGLSLRADRALGTLERTLRRDPLPAARAGRDDLEPLAPPAPAAPARVVSPQWRDSGR